jgi:hypothetical protein
MAHFHRLERILRRGGQSREDAEDLIHVLRYVIKNGFVYEAGTLRMIWPEVREAPRFWW